MRRAAAEHGVRDVSAIELADREQIERGREQPEPCRKRHRVHVDRHAVGQRRPRPATPPRERAAARPARRREIARAARSITDSASPRNSAGTATTKPAIGPAIADVEQRDLRRNPLADPDERAERARSAAAAPGRKKGSEASTR